MTGIEVVKDIKRAKGISNAELARKLGYASASGVRERLERTSDKNPPKDMAVDTLVRYLEALGYELCVREQGKAKPAYTIKKG